MSIPFWKSLLRQVQATGSKHSSKPVNRWFKWMSPGILVKRWLLISATGVILTVLGLAIWVKLTPINRLIDLIGQLFKLSNSLTP